MSEELTENQELEVWKRILASSADSDIKMNSEEEIIELVQGVISNQLKQSVFCKALSRFASNRRTLRTISLISNRDYSAARRLAAMLLSRNRNLQFAFAENPERPIEYYRSSLRDAWRNEVSLTAQCTSASEGTEDVPLIQALLGAARWHAENAIELKRLFEQGPN